MRFTKVSLTKGSWNRKKRDQLCPRVIDSWFHSAWIELKAGFHPGKKQAVFFSIIFLTFCAKDAKLNPDLEVQLLVLVPAK